MPRVWPVALGLMRAFRPTLTLWASLSLLPSSALACTCPPAMEVPITELYRWQIGRQDTPGRPQLKAIQPLLSPTLYQNLTAVYQLKPGEGRGYLDFDPFSGTQVTTHNVLVVSCTGDSADVAVFTGLRGRLSEAPQRLSLQMQQGPAGTWVVDDITYPWGGQLSSVLSGLLQQ